MKNKRQIILIIVFSFLLILTIILRKNKTQTFWQIRPAQEVLFNNQSDNSQLFIPSNRKNIQAININSGEINWQFNSGSFITSQLIILDDYLFFMTEDQTLFSVNKKDGQLKWKKNFGLETGQIQKYENYLLLNQLDGKITLIDSGGKIIWDLTVNIPNTNPPKNYSTYNQSEVQDWSMKFLFGESSIYVFFQNMANKIDVKTGQLLWTQTLENQVAAQPLLLNGLIVLADQKGNIFKLDPENGQAKCDKTISTETNEQITSINIFLTNTATFLITISNKISYFLSRYNLFSAKLLDSQLNNLINNIIPARILFIDNQGAVNLLKQNNLEEIWKTETELTFPRLLEINENYILMANHEQILALNHDGSIAWKKDIPEIHQYLKIKNPFFRKLLPFNKEVLVLTSFENSIIALNAKTGQKIWEFNNHFVISSPLIELPKALIVISDNGLVYRINKFKGTISENIKINHEVNLENVQDKDILKIDFISSKNYFKSPFYQIKINCNFQSPSGSTHQRSGFYYDYNQWQVRFNPQEEGQWIWQCDFIGPGIKKNFSGSFCSEWR